MRTGITFLGTGGGRHTTMFQARSTGGFILEHDGKFLHVDPGPGALTNMNRIRYDLRRTDTIIISHCHPDHYSNAEVTIEGMCAGGFVKRGSVYGSPSVVEGSGKLGPCLSKYHIGLPEKTGVFRPGDVLDIDGMKTEIKKANHSDPDNVGFVFHTSDGIVSYVSDTEYFDGISEQYKGTKILILPVTTHDSHRIPFHLCTDDAIKMVNEIRPELTIFVHLGVTMLSKNPELQAKKCEDATGIRTIAGEDLMTIDVSDVSIGTCAVCDEPWLPKNPFVLED